VLKRLCMPTLALTAVLLLVGSYTAADLESAPVTAFTIADAKRLSDGESVALSAKVVTFAAPASSTSRRTRGTAGSAWRWLVTAWPRA